MPADVLVHPRSGRVRDRKTIRSVMLRAGLVVPPFALVALTALLVAEAAPAYASCNGMAYNYSEQFSQPENFLGVERFISTPSSRLYNDNYEHILFYLQIFHSNDPGQTCPETTLNGSKACWIQDGLGMGNVSGHVARSLTPYLEVSGPNNYYYPSFYGSLSQDSFFTIYFVRFDGSYALFNVYANNTFVGSFDQYNADNYISATAEMYSSLSIGAHCPTIDTGGSDAWFGTSGYGNPQSGYQLANTTDGSNWYTWTSGVNVTANYEFDRLVNNSAFGAKGGSD